MFDVIVIGDGPGGLSAALFLAKNGQQTLVIGEDKTAMHWAHLHNYLGVTDVSGTAFQAAARAQVTAVGAELRAAHVETIARGDPAGWRVTLAGGEVIEARELILSEGKAPKLALQIGLAFDPEQGIATDRNARTEPGVYVVGRSARPGRSQAIISAGDGAAAAIDILSRVHGKDFVDWDQPPKTE